MRDTLLTWFLLLGGGFSAWLLVRSFRVDPSDTDQGTTQQVTFIDRRPATTWQPPAKAAPYLAAFSDAERIHRLPRNLLARMAQQESNFNPDARGASGEVGMMQIIPKWHPGVDAANPYTAIDYAGRLMRRHYDRFGSWEKALAAYNWGPTALSSYGYAAAPASTKRYIAAISTDVVLV